MGRERRVVIWVPAEGFKPEKGPDQLSDVCIARLDRARHLFFDGPNRVIVVCGGRFAPHSHQTKDAGSLMREWLTSHGVPLLSIIVEWESLDTYQNISHSIRVMQIFGAIVFANTDIIVVSEELHAKRIKHTFKAAHRIDVLTECLPDRPGLFRWFTDRFFVLYHWLDTYGTWYPARRSREKRRLAAQT